MSKTIFLTFLIALTLSFADGNGGKGSTGIKYFVMNTKGNKIVINLKVRNFKSDCQVIIQSITFLSTTIAVV
jgi:hypothetical protein